MRIAVICSLAYEMDKLENFMEDVYDEEIAGFPVLEGTVGRHSLFVASTGTGKVNTAATTQALISEYTPDLVVNVGLGGNCDYELPVGAAVVATEFRYHDVDPTILAAFPDFENSFPTDLALQALTRRVLTSMGLAFKSGVVATGDRFINSKAAREDIVNRTDCLSVDMEGAAVANVCRRNSMPLVAVRILGDDADDDATSDFSYSAVQYSDLAAEIVYKICRSLEA